MRQLYLLDSITQITSDMGDAVLVSGSHGGISSASYVVKAPNKPMAVFFNDAGVGKDRAGIKALDMMDELGVMAFAYGHESARIGESTDGLDYGVITHLNRTAAQRFQDSVGSAVVELVQLLCNT